MDVTTLSDRLSILGLPEKDALVYITLLKLGPASVSQISKVTEFNRSSLYVILERLAKRGLVSTSGEVGVRKYVAAPPDRLALTAKEEVERSSLLFQNIAALLPALKSTHKASKLKPKVVILEGTEGQRQAFEEILLSKEKVVRVFSSTKDIYESLPDYLPISVQQRLARGIKMYGIHPDDEFAKQTMRLVPNNLDDITLVPHERFRFPSDFAVFDNKIAFMSHRPPFCASIENREIAEVMKVAFDLAKQEAKRISRKRT